MNRKNANDSDNSHPTHAVYLTEGVNYDSAQFERLTSGYRLGEFQNYRLLKCLGEGGMGQTWLAEELSGGEVVQNVVVKVIPKEFCGPEKDMEEVRRVFNLTAKLRHPNICALLGMKKDHSFGWFLVMDYVDGGTLSDWFKNQPNHENGLPLAQILPILRPIAEALDFAHHEGILHRDVKPQNIMFAGRKPILIDFGIAAHIRPENVAHVTNPNHFATAHASATSGTPIYMAPEQMRRKPQTGRTDQYALALVLYELLAGKIPFADENFAEILFQKTIFNPENPNFPASVNSALRKALSTSPDQRFTTCSEFFNALSVPTEPPKGRTSQPTYDELVQANLRKLMEEQERADLEARARAEAERLINQRRSSARKAGERMVKTANGIEYAFRWCPAGTFTMGSPTSESDRYAQHKVTLTRGFWMLETQVTQAMWKSVMGKNPSHFKGEQNPVECISWNDCPRSFAGNFHRNLVSK